MYGAREASGVVMHLTWLQLFSNRYRQIHLDPKRSTCLWSVSSHFRRRLPSTATPCCCLALIINIMTSPHHITSAMVDDLPCHFLHVLGRGCLFALLAPWLSMVGYRPQCSVNVPYRFPLIPLLKCDGSYVLVSSMCCFCGVHVRGQNWNSNSHSLQNNNMRQVHVVSSIAVTSEAYQPSLLFNRCPSQCQGNSNDSS